MAKEKKHTYGWVKKLVNKITKADAPLNNSFEYYGYGVEQLSGTPDYTSVDIFDKGTWRNELVRFSFDFMTRKLHFFSYADNEIRMAFVKAFVLYYNSVNVSDELLKDRRLEYQWYLDNSEEYDEDVLEDAKKELEIIDNLPMGWVKMKDLKDK